MFSSARATLITLATPAAPIVWPILDFIEPTPQKPFFVVKFLNARFIPDISVGSPNFVAVPCASI